MADKNLLRKLKGSIKVSKAFRKKMEELEQEQEIQRYKLKPPKEEIPKQEEIKDDIFKKSIVKIEMGTFLIKL